MLKIIKMQAENFKRLIMIDITPNDTMNQIVGSNGSGKSSLIDCIPALTGGANGVPGMPIKIGEEKSRIKMALGTGTDRIEYWVSKTFTKKNQKGILKIEDASGHAISESPQSFLDKIRSHISFDPLDLIERTDKNELKKILFSVLGINIDELDNKEKSLRKSREDLAKDVKKSEALYNSSTRYLDIKETEEIKIADLTKKLTESMDFNQKIKDRINTNEQLKAAGIRIKNEEIPRHERSITTLGEDIKELEQKIADKKAEIEQERKTITSLHVQIADKKASYIVEQEAIVAVTPIDVQALKQEMQDIESKNLKIRKNAEYCKNEKVYKDVKKQYDSYTTQIESTMNEKSTILKNAKWPIPGFSYHEGELFFNNIPLDQVNDADKLRVGLGIAMAQKPELRVIWTRRGSLVDSKNRKIIQEMVKDKEFQIFYESVAERDDDGNVPKVGFYLEEGELRAINGAIVDNTDKCDALEPAQKIVQSETKNTDDSDW